MIAAVFDCMVWRWQSRRENTAHMPTWNAGER
jgi:hypothetical protein